MERTIFDLLPEEILQSCKASVSLLNSLKSGRKRVIEFASGDAAPAHAYGIRDPKRRRCAREEVTAAPFGDGHQWRKYGEKSIKGSSFKRSYYRCTYSEDQRCEAKKKVQQKDSSSYLVIHEGQHTCTSFVTTDHMVPLDSLHGLHSVPRTTVTAAPSTSSVPLMLSTVSGGCGEINIIRGDDVVRGTIQPKRESQCSTSTTSDLENLTDHLQSTAQPVQALEPLQLRSMYDTPEIGSGSIALMDEAFSPCDSPSLAFFDMEELLSSSEFDCI